MKIVHVTEFFHPSMGGIETEVFQISRLEAARGHDVTVVTQTVAGAEANEEISGIKVVRSSAFRNPLRILSLCKATDVIHIHDVVFPSLLVEKLQNHKTVVSLYGWTHICPRNLAFRPERNQICVNTISDCLKCFECHAYSDQHSVEKMSLLAFPYSIANHLFISWPRVLTVMSECMKKAHAVATRRSDIEVVPGGVDIETFDRVEPLDVRLELGIEDKPFVLFVGRLFWFKGVNYLIAAAKKLDVDVRIVIVGNGPEYSALHDLVQKLSVDKQIIFVRGIRINERDKLIRLYKACDIVVIPSIWQETFGIVALEAMAAKKPVIASRVGGLREIVDHGKTGFLVEPGDPNQLADSIQKLLLDRSLRGRFGQAAYEKAKKYSWEAITDSFLRIYESLF